MQTGGGAYVRFQFDENVGSLPCVTKILYDISYFTPQVMGREDYEDPDDNVPDEYFYRQAEPTAFWVDRNLVNRQGTWQNYNIDDFK